ncbi:MAG: hypothetical protein KDA81_00030 [Planctomycetaceae bacterium]|nr:hypothetical protein [Planctomycetaceae bacterium]
MQKAIGFIACVSVMAMSLYLFSGGDPSRMLSAQTETEVPDSYGSVARRFMNDARQLAKQGDVKGARRLAETAASLSAVWKPGEQTPEQFLKELDGNSAEQRNPWSLGEAADWPSLTANAESDSKQEDFAFEETPASKDVLNKRKAQKLMQEARKALDEGDIALARTRVMQARGMKVSWGLWDERPEHLLAEIDRADGATTFFADAKAGTEASVSGGSQNAEQTYQQAQSLIQQARAAIDAGRFQQAESLAAQADSLNATYGLFEDSPAMIRRDLQRLSQAGQVPANAFVSATEADEQSPETRQAKQLLAEARTEFRQGNVASAREKALKAQSLSATYSLLEDTPERLLSEIDSAVAGQGQQNPFETRNENPFGQLNAGFAQSTHSGPIDMTPNRTTPSPKKDVNGFTGFDNLPARDGVAVVNPEGVSAEASLQSGIALLEQGDRQGALRALTLAWQHAGQLDAGRRETLHVLLEQVEGNQNEIALTSGSSNTRVAFDERRGDPMDPMTESDPLRKAANELEVRITRLRTEVLNSVFRAEKVKEQNPEEALQILDRTLATVEAADLPEESAKVLAGHLQRTQKSIQTYMEQRAPILANEERNRNVRERIQNEIENQIRIEQEFADLTQQFNDLMRQRRYAEAELIANKAKDLNPNLPQAVIMVEKAKLQRQINFIEEVKTNKADNALQMLNEVDIAFGNPIGDYVLPDAKSWADMSSRRARFGSADARTRTESELRIEKSLGETISLHFHDVPLTDIIRHIATTHGINITLDTRAMETEGLMPNQVVSIDVDGITLRSALNLLLDQAGGLVYDIENEVLKITNRLEQDTTFKTRAYNVADLVVPLGQTSAANPYNSSALTGATAYGNGLFQIDDDLTVGIGGNGMPRTAGGMNTPQARGVDFSGLVDLITTTVEPGTWDLDGGAGRLEGNENTLSLVIRQTPAVHDQIVDLLGQLRKLQDLQVTVEVRFISVTDRFFERIGVDFDFNVQDTLGDPPGVPAFGSRQLTFPGATGGGNNNNSGLRGGNQQGNNQNQQGAAQGLFDSVPRVNSPRDDFSSTVVGLASPDSFTQDYDIQFRQGSFELGVPDFGNFNPDAGIQVGMAILSDLEAFFFIQAAQADERANILFAPKVTLFNGQLATISDVTTRPFVIGLLPVVGTGAVGFQPIIQPLTDGIVLTVVAVISADRRFVRLSLSPQFNNVVDVFTFSFASGGAGGGAIGGGFGQGGGGGGFGGGGGGFGGGGFGGGGGGLGFGGIGGAGGGFGGGGGGIGGGQNQQGQGGAAGGTLTVQQPVQESINVSTTVSVPDGGTVLLGGIKRLREGRNMAGVPILNKIPYISRLFKNSGVGRETESVMLMVTPRIIIHEEEEELILGNSGPN